MVNNRRIRRKFSRKKSYKEALLSGKKFYNESQSSKVMYRPELSNLIVSYLPDFQPEVNMSDFLKTLNKYRHTIDNQTYNNILRAIDPNLHENTTELLTDIVVCLGTMGQQVPIINNPLSIKLYRYFLNIIVSLIQRRPTTQFDDRLINSRVFKRACLLQYIEAEESNVQLLPKHLEDIFYEWVLN